MTGHRVGARLPDALVVGTAPRPQPHHGPLEGHRLQRRRAAVARGEQLVQHVVGERAAAQADDGVLDADPRELGPLEHRLGRGVATDGARVQPAQAEPALGAAGEGVRQEQLEHLVHDAAAAGGGLQPVAQLGVTVAARPAQP